MHRGGGVKTNVFYSKFWHASACVGVEGGGGKKLFKNIKTVYIPFNIPSSFFFENPIHNNGFLYIPFKGLYIALEKAYVELSKAL